MATKKPALFEKSSKDKEPKNMKESSKREEAMDKKQAAAKFCSGGMAKKRK